MLRIGITGGIGSGKTEVRRMFERAGLPTLSADEIAKTIANNNPTVRNRIVRLLGRDAYRPDGVLDRAAVAARVFGRRSKERALNAIIHPLVRREVRHRFRILERQGVAAALVEAALIYEAGMEGELDMVIVVDARRSLRTRRVMKRDQASQRSIEMRMAAQWSTIRKRRKAEIVLENNGTIRQLRTAVRFLVRLFHHTAG